jgi:hypothetical protein
MTVVIAGAFSCNYLSPMKNFEQILSGGDRRSSGKVNVIAASSPDNRAFAALFRCLLHKDRRVAMRAADAVEKITRVCPELLAAHKDDVLTLAFHTNAIELQWHLAQIFPRLDLQLKEKSTVTRLLLHWATDTTTSRILRANAVESLYELGKKSPASLAKLLSLLDVLEKEDNPSLKARIKKIRNQLSKEQSIATNKKLLHHR